MLFKTKNNLNTYTMLTFNELIEQVLKEENVSGGAGSAFGPGVEAEGATQFSADTYNKGSAVIAKPLGKKRKNIIKRNIPKDTIFTGRVKK